jgi:molybdenum cofactor synthesis domain-containing protein
MREVREGENVRRRAEEVSAGDVVLEAGEVIGPAAVGLLASTGHATATVYRRPRVAVISTGDELVEVAEKPGPGKIRNSNSYSISAQVIAAGGIPLRYPILGDDLDATREAFTRAAAEADFIVTSGGVSVGDFDYVKPVLEELGEMEFCKVAMRPGNPQTLGSIEGVPFFGLPGNPTSTFVGFESSCARRCATCRATRSSTGHVRPPLSPTTSRRNRTAATSCARCSSVSTMARSQSRSREASPRLCSPPLTAATVCSCFRRAKASSPRAAPLKSSDSTWKKGSYE